MSSSALNGLSGIVQGGPGILKRKKESKEQTRVNSQHNRRYCFSSFLFNTCHCPGCKARSACSSRIRRCDCFHSKATQATAKKHFLLRKRVTALASVYIPPPLTPHHLPRPIPDAVGLSAVFAALYMFSGVLSTHKQTAIERQRQYLSPLDKVSSQLGRLLSLDRRWTLLAAHARGADDMDAEHVLVTVRQWQGSPVPLRSSTASRPQRPLSPPSLNPSREQPGLSDRTPSCGFSRRAMQSQASTTFLVATVAPLTSSTTWPRRGSSSSSKWTWALRPMCVGSLQRETPCGADKQAWPLTACTLPPCHCCCRSILCLATAILMLCCTLPQWPTLASPLQSPCGTTRTLLPTRSPFWRRPNKTAFPALCTRARVPCTLRRKRGRERPHNGVWISAAM